MTGSGHFACRLRQSGWNALCCLQITRLLLPPSTHTHKHTLQIWIQRSIALHATAEASIYYVLAPILTCFF